MASGPETDQLTFGEWLRRTLDEENVSISALARKLNPKRPKSARRSLHRYLADEGAPSPARAAEVAVALGRSPDEVKQFRVVGASRVRGLETEVEELRAVVGRQEQQIREILDRLPNQDGQSS